jgi:hypothetical protein
MARWARIAEADAWLEMSGAKSYEPFLHVERAELARLSGDDTARRRELREAGSTLITAPEREPARPTSPPASRPTSTRGRTRRTRLRRTRHAARP